jgi:chemotaxis family two-component system response regulator Rcp1
MTSPRVIRVLVVEDSPAYLYLIQKAFSNRVGAAKWELTAAKDGEEAMHILFADEKKNLPLPDIILLDWRLPKLSGGEVLRRVKDHQELRKIPVLIFSSSETEEDIHAAYGDHANGFITKPGDNAVLVSIVETIEQFWIAVAQLPKVARTGVRKPAALSL